MKKILIVLIASLLVFLAKAQSPTWSDNIAKIVYANCTPCHHPGGLAPSSFLTYQNTVPYAGIIRFAVNNRIMPPWPADPNYKRYAHDLVLTNDEITAIDQWVTNGAPSGDLRFAPATPSYNTNTQLGTVDLSYQMQTFTVPNNGDVYRNFVINTGLSQTTFITAIEVIPGNPEIVHHVLVFMDTTSNAINPNSGGGTGSNASQLIYGFVPGAQPYFTPPGTGFRFPPNTRIIFQMHYAPGSQGIQDSTRINFKTSSAPVRQITVVPLLNHWTSMINGPLSIPANTTRTFHQQFSVPFTATVLSAWPHMHMVGKSIISYATTASNDTIRFVNIPNWDFHWQMNYTFPNTVRVPSGSVLRATAYYDNTVNNQHNPNSPPQNVTSGEGTGDEMMMVFFAYMPYMNGDENLIVDKRIIPEGATTFCDGQSVELKTIEGNGYNYQWYKNGSIINGANNASFNVTQAGSYTVSITLGPNNAVSDPVAVIVNPTPTATITPPSTTIIPAGGSIVLEAATGSGYAYRWYKDGALINGANSSTYAANTSGVYNVEVFNGCYAVSNPVSLTTSGSNHTVATSAQPISGGATTGDGTYAAGSTATVTATANMGYVFVEWRENGTAVSTDPSYSFMITADRSLEAVFDQSVGIADFSGMENISVFPNPSSGIVYFSKADNCDLKVFNALGQLVYASKINAHNRQIELKHSGIYIVKLTSSDGQTVTKRLVVEAK